MGTDVLDKHVWTLVIVLRSYLIKPLARTDCTVVLYLCFTKSIKYVSEKPEAVFYA